MNDKVFLTKAAEKGKKCEENKSAHRRDKKEIKHFQCNISDLSYI